MAGRRMSPDLEDVISYITSVKKKFHDDPSKYYKCVMLLNDYTEKRADLATVVERLEEIMKDHHDLLLGLNEIFSIETKQTINDKTKRTIPLEDTNQHIKPDVEDSFVEKLKIRFCKIDTHVVDSYLEIMKRFKEGKMSGKEVLAEVVDLLYNHEDLIEDFARNFST